MALTLNPSRLRLTTAQWFGRVYRAGAGTVTSVDGDGGTTGLTLTGGPIITTGTLTLGGILDPSAGGTGATDLTGLAASALLINTTAPLAGGGDLTTDRTLSIAITPADDGGAVALQAATPGTEQTGHLHISGTGLAGRLVAGTLTGSTEMIYAARTVNDGNWAAVGVNCTDTATGSQLNIQNDSSDQGQLFMVGSAYAGTGSAGALTPRTVSLYSSTGASGGLKLATGHATGDIEFYTAGVDAAQKRMSIDHHGTVTMGYGWAPTGVDPPPLRVQGTIEVTNGSGGGFKFADGSIQYTAVGGSGGMVPQSRLINTTLPLDGGGDLSADRTLTLAVTVGNDGGAVALQASPPVAVQVGGLAVDGDVMGEDGHFTGTVTLLNNGNSQLQVLNQNNNNTGGDTTVSAAYSLRTFTADATFELCNANFAGTGARQANSANLIANANATAGLSIAAQAAAPIRFYTGGITASEIRATLGATGHLDLELSKLTAGTMTVVHAGLVKKVIHRFDWTNQMIVILGAVGTGEINVCTLPAKTVVTNAYVVIKSPDTSANALTVSVGYTAASYIDLIIALSAKAAANTVYGDGGGERGTNLTGYVLPSFTATTLVKAQFVKSVTNLDTVVDCTGSIYLETMLLP